jgi:uncharacterized protein (TIGR02145 family)
MKSNCMQNLLLKVIMRLLAIFILLCFIQISIMCINPAKNNDKFGTITDIDGNVYRTVKIDEQIWMAENLRTTRLTDGTPIFYRGDSNSNNQLSYCYYNNVKNKDSIKMFGALYNGYTVTSNKLAPQGWHIPTTLEWMRLGIALCIEENRNNFAAVQSGFCDNIVGFSGIGDCGIWWSSVEYDSVNIFYYYINKNQIGTESGVSRKSSYFSVRLMKDSAN